ncbi:hypothetical protein VTI74DRAFT_3844 [Chaetomium olivicolor]
MVGLLRSYTLGLSGSRGAEPCMCCSSDTVLTSPVYLGSPVQISNHFLQTHRDVTRKPILNIVYYTAVHKEPLIPPRAQFYMILVVNQTQPTPG